MQGKAHWECLGEKQKLLCILHLFLIRDSAGCSLFQVAFLANVFISVSIKRRGTHCTVRAKRVANHISETQRQIPICLALTEVSCSALLLCKGSEVYIRAEIESSCKYFSPPSLLQPTLIPDAPSRGAVSGLTLTLASVRLVQTAISSRVDMSG